MTILRLERAKRILIAALLAACGEAAGCNESRETRDASGGGGTGGGGGSGMSTACPGTFNGSCLLRGGTECLDYSNLPDSGAVASVEAMCEEDGLGQWMAATPCPHTGALGACSQSQAGPCQARWWYTGTLADRMADCADAMGTWVSP